MQDILLEYYQRISIYLRCNCIFGGLWRNSYHSNFKILFARTEVFICSVDGKWLWTNVFICSEQVNVYEMFQLTSTLAVEFPGEQSVLSSAALMVWLSVEPWAPCWDKSASAVWFNIPTIATDKFTFNPYTIPMPTEPRTAKTYLAGIISEKH